MEYFKFKYLEAVDQIKRGPSIRCKGHKICPNTGNIEVGGKVVAHIGVSPSGRHLVIEFIDIDPELFVFDDEPQAVWHVDLLHDLDLIDEIEFLADHVIHHVVSQTASKVSLSLSVPVIAQSEGVPSHEA